MHFEGPCPFLTCLEDGPHEHPTCSACGAVGHGNLFCSTCRSTWPDTPFRRELDAAIGEGVKVMPVSGEAMKAFLDRLGREVPAAVGDLVTVGRPCMGNPPGARAIVVEVYQSTWQGADYTGWSLLFENGNHDGFSPDDCHTFDVRKIGHLSELAAYRFTTAIRLYQDWRAGKFASVWNGVRA